MLLSEIDKRNEGFMRSRVRWLVALIAGLALATWLVVTLDRDTTGRAKAESGRGQFPARPGIREGGLLGGGAPQPPETSEVVIGLIRQGELASARMATAGVLTQILQSQCEGKIKLSSNEIDSVVSLLEARAWEEQWAALKGGLASDSALALCLLRHMARGKAPAAGDQWAEMMMLASKNLVGGFAAANAQLTEIAVVLLASRPVVGSEAWWREFWRASEQGDKAIHVRKAVFEALSEKRGGPDAILSLQTLAEFCDTSKPVGNLSIPAMGLSMSALLTPKQAYAELATRRSYVWARAALWSVSPNDLWPRRAVELEPYVADSMLKFMRESTADPDARLLQRAMLDRTWELLGPELAGREWTEYVASPSSNLRSAGMRLAATCFALATHGVQNGATSQERLRAGEAGVRRMLGTSRYELAELVSAALESAKLSQSKNARDFLVRMLGDDVRHLRRDVYARLVR